MGVVEGVLRGQDAGETAGGLQSDILYKDEVTMNLGRADLQDNPRLREKATLCAYCVYLAIHIEHRLQRSGALGMIE